MAQKKNTISSLLEAYNEAARALGKKELKSFKSVAVAEQRTKAILKELAKSGKRSSTSSKAKAERKPRDPLAFISKEVNAPREGSLPFAIMQALLAKGGASMPELEALVAERDKEQGQEPVNLFSRVQRLMRHLYFYNSLDLELKGDKIVGTIRS